MGLFEDKLKEGESIFLNPVVLDYDYQPKLTPHRENQQKYVATCIKPLFQGRNGKNLFIFGSPGIGKTVSCRHVLKELEEQTDEIIPIYINCWKKNTAHKIILEICDILNYKFTHNKSSDELLKIIIGLLNKKAVVFCFDEVDKLNEKDIIYNLLEDVYKKTFIFITNENDWLVKLDNRIRSRLYAEVLEYKPYTYNETLDILKQRCEYAFVSGVLSKDILEEISKRAYDLMDLRVGLYLLKETGNVCEEKGCKTIEKSDLDQAVCKLDGFKIKEDLKDDQNVILDLIKKNNGESISLLSKIYNEKCGLDISYKTFRRRLDKLEKANLIKLEEEFTGVKGKSVNVYFKDVRRLDEF